MKILVDLYVPVIDQRFDILLPDFLSVKEIIELIAEAIEKLGNNQFRAFGNEALCCQKSNMIIAGDRTLKDYNVQNGDTLVLI